MVELGPRLFEFLNAHQHVGTKAPVVYGVEGRSAAEIADIEAELGFRLPEDAIYLLRNVRDVDGVLFPSASYKRHYLRHGFHVRRGIEFDIEHGFWMERWGERPETLPAQIEVFRNDFRSWPKLIPLGRYLPVEPCQAGNPVFSIVQTDTIYYGFDLADYLVREFVRRRVRGKRYEDVRRIDVWSDMVDGYASMWPYTEDPSIIEAELAAALAMNTGRTEST